MAWPIFVILSRNTVEDNFLAYGLMLLAGVTDYFDGYFARKFNQESDMGRILDPLADKVLVGAIAIVLTTTHGMPLWFLLLIIGRDLAILFLGYFMVSKTKEIPESNWPGKVAVTASALVLTVYVLPLEPYRAFFLWGGTAMLLISTASYVVRFYQFIRAKDN